MNANWTYFFGNGAAEGGDDLKDLIGGKGASLAEMSRAGLDVPPGFTISAKACQVFYQNGENWPDGLLDQIRDSLARLERLSGHRLGKGDNPLLVAVRSGAAQSMPGMMDTILNVGLNPDCVRAMGQRTGDPRGAWEAYYHFLLMFGRTVYGSRKLIDESQLDLVTSEHLKEEKAARVQDLDAGQMEHLCQKLLSFFQFGPGVDFPTEPWELLTGAILAVFRSWNSARAIAYRKHHRIDNLLGTAVNVQMMCPSEVAGVMFTANPVHGSVDEILIESSFGLGEAIVLGKVTPDKFVLDKKTLHIKERQVSKKEYVMATVAASANGLLASCGASLADEQVADLARLGLRVEEYFQTPCDIEWGLSDGRFYLLQSRPIRHKAPAIDPEEQQKVRQDEIAALRALADSRGTVWSRFNLSEILPEPTPMTWAVVREFMSGQGGFGQMYRDLGFSPDPAVDEAGIFDLVCGRPYCNLSREPLMQHSSLPLEHDFVRLKADPSKALYPQATPNFARAGWGFWLKLPFLFLKMAWTNRRLRRMERSFEEKFERDIVPRFLNEVKAAEKEDLSRLSDASLLERFAYWRQRTLFDFARDSLKPTALAGIGLANLERLLAERMTFFSHDAAKAVENRRKGEQRAQAFVRELVMGVQPERESDLPTALSDFAAGKLGKEEFLQHFGHRGSLEMELWKPRWYEDMDALEAARVQGAHAAPVLQAARLHGTAQAREDNAAAVWERLSTEARLLPFQQALLEADVRILHKHLALRETAKHHLMRGYALLRRCLVELDRRRGLDGGIFFLTPQELPALIAAKEPELEKLRKLITQRHKRREVALSLFVPQVLFSDDLEAIGRLEDLQGADVLQGVPLSAGVAEGAAWVLQHAAQSTPPDGDYILVCPSTDPAWVPLFVNARGLVMETGGVLSHGAIVAREFGLPAVAGIADVHRRLKTGQRLRVDGGTGKVNVLDLAVDDRSRRL